MLYLVKKCSYIFIVIYFTFLLCTCGTTSSYTIPNSPTINCSILNGKSPIASTESVNLRFSLQNTPSNSISLTKDSSGGNAIVTFIGNGTIQDTPTKATLIIKNKADNEQQIVIVLDTGKSQNPTYYLVTNCAKHALATIIVSGVAPTTFVADIDFK